MTAQIEEIKRQATIYVNNPTVNSNGKVICDNWEAGISISKLVEVVVLKCIALVEQPDYGSTYDAVIVDICNRIKEHFGVE